MNKITDAVLRNWMTTLGGLMAGLPQLVEAAGFVQTPSLTHWMNLISAIGMLLLGVSAKQFTNHSTAAEVQASTEAKQAKG